MLKHSPEVLFVLYVKLVARVISLVELEQEEFRRRSQDYLSFLSLPPVPSVSVNPSLFLTIALHTHYK